MGLHEGLYLLLALYYAAPREALFLPLREYYVGLRDSLVRQSSIPLMGRSEPVAQMLCACNGPMQVVHPANKILCGPTR